jgi:hypothetical protein
LRPGGFLPARLTWRKAFYSMIVALLLTRRVSFCSMGYSYLVDWKETLPVNNINVPGWLEETLPIKKVHVPCQLEGFPSNQWGTCTCVSHRIRTNPSFCLPSPLVILSLNILEYFISFIFIL